MPNLFVPSSTYSQQVFHRWPLWLVPTTSAISEMTYTVSSGMLNSSIPYQQLPLSYFTQSASSSCSEWGRIMLVVHVSRHVIHWRTSVTQINHVSIANCTSYDTIQQVDWPMWGSNADARHRSSDRKNIDTFWSAVSVMQKYQSQLQQLLRLQWLHKTSDILYYVWQGEFTLVCVLAGFDKKFYVQITF